MKKIRDKLRTRKAQGKATPGCSSAVVAASPFPVILGTLQPLDTVHRRTSDGELYTKRDFSSCRSLAPERPKTVYEMELTEERFPARTESYRRMESSEFMEMAASTGNLPHGSAEGKNETPSANTPRSASLDRENFNVCVEELSRSQSTSRIKKRFGGSKKKSPAPRSNSLDPGNFALYVNSLLMDKSEGQDGGSAAHSETSDDDLDKTPTDVTPYDSSTSLTPTSSREDILLRRRVWKRFSSRWHRKKRYSVVRGE